jgi:hypothetical protein
MIRKLLLAASLLALGTAAHATEVNPDPGCDSAGSWMADTGAAVSGSKCVFSNVSAMKGLMITAPLVKEGHRYKATATVSDYTGCSSHHHRARHDAQRPASLHCPRRI